MNKIWSAIQSLILGVSIMVLLTSCAKDTAEFETISNSQKPEGQGMLVSQQNGDKNKEKGFAEGELEPLDSTGESLFEDTTSDEYKTTFGRSTAPLLPIYFAFDSSSIDIEQFDNLNKSVTYLKENSTSELVIEGNCDERGTADYNIALGEQRAQSVRKYLINYGIEDDRISTISFGAERPLYPESNETAWAKNRRADLVLP